jgi:hypothetical protein
MSKLNYSLERHLFHLLFQEDIVDVPGFGRIEVQKFDAEIQEQSGLCLPAARRISFSPIAKKSEVLINHLARYEGLSFDSARGTIESITRNWRKELSQGKRLRLEGIGSFSKTGLQWVFQASVEANFLPEAFGLPIFRITPLSQKEFIPKEFNTVAPLKELENKKRTRKWRSPVRTAAVMIGVLSLLALGTTKDDYREMIQNASLKPNWKLLEDKLKAWSNSEKIDIVKEITINQPLDINNKEDFVKTPAKQIKKNSKELKANDDFSLIVGAFAEINNAERLVENLQSKGYPAALIKRKGELTKVAIESFHNRESAQLEKENVRLQFPGVWIYTQ